MDSTNNVFIRLNDKIAVRRFLLSNLIRNCHGSWYFVVFFINCDNKLFRANKRQRVNKKLDIMEFIVIDNSYFNQHETYLLDIWVLSSLSLVWFDLISFIWDFRSFISSFFLLIFICQSCTSFSIKESSSFSSNTFFANYLPSFDNLLFCSISCL